MKQGKHEVKHEVKENKTLEAKLKEVYGEETGCSLLNACREKQKKHAAALARLPWVQAGRESGKTLPLSEKDSILITYANSLRPGEGESGTPLGRLKNFADRFLQEKISTIHLLPFFPYSSDDGFSVIDYRRVNPDCGTWDDVRALGENFSLMFDLVLNHCSVRHEWFQKYRDGDPEYRDYFIEMSPDEDLSSVFRPRALPLLTEFETAHGKKHLWTTFSADQVDLNFASPRVFLEFVDIFFFFVLSGARMIRLDAVGFLWKELGTSCMHHPKTHSLIQIFRELLDESAPGTILITETNVPHRENISYFGNPGEKEAHLVYQFSLPPLTLDALLRGEAGHLKTWAETLNETPENVSFLNFLASHDGIGVLGGKAYLREEEMKNLLEEVENRGGRISYKNTPTGKIPYELNINYRDAVSEQRLSPAQRADKFLAAQSVMLALPGIPGIYVHSLLGSGNWTKGVEKTGQNRSINREQLCWEEGENPLLLQDELRRNIFSSYLRFLELRNREPAFSPESECRILSLDPGVFALERISRDQESHILCLTNFQNRTIVISSDQVVKGRFRSLFEESVFDFSSEDQKLELKGFEVKWLRKE